MAVTINGTTGIITPDIGVDGSTLVVDSVNNRIGIEIDNPRGKLEVSGDGIFTQTSASIKTDCLQVGFTSPNGFIKSKNSSGSPASNLDFYTTDTNGNTNLGIRVQYTGNVGIGQSNPQSKLQIENAGEQLRLTYPSIASYIHEVKSNGDYAIDRDGTERLRITSNGTVDFKDNNITNVGTIALDSIKGDADDNTNITFAGSDTITFKAGSTSPALTINTTQVKIEDNQKFVAGTGNDLEIYHDGNHTRIHHSGIGQFVIYGNDNDQVKLMKGSSEEGIILNNNGNVELYHNNSRKLETTSTGTKITGDITADAFIFSDDYPTSTPVLDLNFAREKKLDSRITFTRNSVATYFDAESSEVLEENNMDYSSNFSQWTTAGGTLSNSSWARPIPGWDSRQVTLFTENTSGGTHRIYRGIDNRYYDNNQLNKVYTISFFAKYSSRQYLQLNASALNYNARIIFDIQNGYVTDYASALSAGVIDYGNDWYRCWATIQADTVAPVNTVVTCPVGGNSTRSGNGESYTGNESSFYLWGYQVEFSDTLGPYVQTNGKTFRKLGPVIKTAAIDEPRFVYDPSTKESLGLLIEQQATNKQPYTNNLTSAIATNGVTASISYWSNIATAPNGKLEAGRVKGSGTNDNQRLGFTYNIANGEDGAFSAFLKADPNNSGDIIVHLYTNTFIAGNSAFNVNLNDGTSNVVGGTSDLFTKVEPYPDGWYRVTMGGTSSGATNGSMNINIANSLDATRVANSDSSNAYFIWGVQFETGSLNDATSYIENTSTGTKTRSAELAEVRGSNFSSWFNNTEGTILAEYRGGQLTSEIPVHISDESYRSNTSIQIGSSSSGPISGYVTVGSINNRGTTEAFFQANTAYPTEGESIKTALTYKHNYAQMVTTDGSGTYTGTVDTDVDLPWLNMMTIGKDSYYGIYNNNPIKRLAFYGNTLTEAQLQNIVKY